jgi:very-short-patch-repair endonuclease
MTPLQDKFFLAALTQAGIPAPVAEYKFHPIRRWRFDFCWLDQKLALEIQGGIFNNGRHSRGAAMIKEWEKLNTAAGMGYRLLYCQPSGCTKIETIDAIKAALDYNK